MATDEEPWWADKQVLADRGIISARISADVFDEYIRAFDGEAVYFRIGLPDFSTIDVSTYSTKRTEGSELFGYLQRTDVTAMPNFVELLEMFQVAVVPMAMSVR
jgi:hypothetical protein